MSGIALVLMLSGVVVIRGGLLGLSPVGAFQDIFARATGGTGGLAAPGVSSARVTPTRSSTKPTTQPQFTPNVERWRGLVSAHFPATVVDQALSVMECESEGIPSATNPTTQAAGLFQHLPKYWVDRSRRAGVPGGSIYDPVANVTVAGWLYGQSGTWNHWSCKPTI